MTGELLDWTSGVARVVVTSCASCGVTWYLPRESCPACHSRTFSRTEAGGGGLCVAVTTVHVTGEDGPSEPFGLALVLLDEGPLVMGRVRHALSAGNRAQLSFVASGRQLLPGFAPA
jgi:uncharacterized OB-fold protein